MRDQVVPLGDWVPLPGIHNFQNALAAACAAFAIGCKPGHLRAGLAQYEALPHRLQLVAEEGGRRFYNDSKATTPEAVCLALRAFHRPIVLLAGGYDKGVDLSPLARAIVSRDVKAVALLGQTASALGTHLAQAGCDPSRWQPFQTLEQAFNWGAAQTSPGDVVLLSPGCASYDWFRNYEERGETFARLARAWLAPREASRSAS
jgi:UDP-N-acetylmuramoylalanine--D-glutamate ligase